MPTPPEEVDFIRDLRVRSAASGGIFWAGDELAVFDPDTAQQINAANFADLTLPDKLADLLRRRPGEPVSWKQVRAAWIAQMRRVADAEGVARLAERMRVLLDQQLDRPLDLVWLTQELCVRSLLPVVVTGLSSGDTARILRWLLTPQSSRERFWQAARSILIQVRAGQVIRRELRGRASGRRPRQLDLCDPIVELLPELGIDRAIDTVTAVLTAIASPPGAAAACLLYELTRRPEWADRLEQELAAISPAELCGASGRVAPVTQRFVKETLRMWSSPLVMAREARADIRLERVQLKTGQRYLVSPYFTHHDPQHWNDPDAFDPDRWLPGAQHGPSSGASYVPFGWSPKVCVGASLATTQLVLLCHLFCTRYRIQLAAPESLRMLLSAVPLPQNFHATITCR
jgi:cytochrome P450